MENTAKVPPAKKAKQATIYTFIRDWSWFLNKAKKEGRKQPGMFHALRLAYESEQRRLKSQQEASV